MVDEGYNSELPSGHTIATFRFARSPAGVWNYTLRSIRLGLRENYSNPSVTGIGVKDKIVAVIWESQNWGGDMSVPEFYKCCLAVYGPFKLVVLLSEVMQRLGDGGEILYEAAVVACKSQELLNLFLRLRYWPILLLSPSSLDLCVHHRLTQCGQGIALPCSTDLTCLV